MSRERMQVQFCPWILWSQGHHSFQPFSSTRATVCSLVTSLHCTNLTFLFCLWKANIFLQNSPTHPLACSMIPSNNQAQQQWICARSWGILPLQSTYLTLQSPAPFNRCFSVWVSRSRAQYYSRTNQWQFQMVSRRHLWPTWTMEVIFNLWERHSGIGFTAVLTYTQMKGCNLKAAGNKICFLL